MAQALSSVVAIPKPQPPNPKPKPKPKKKGLKSHQWFSLYVLVRIDEPMHTNPFTMYWYVFGLFEARWFVLRTTMVGFALQYIQNTIQIQTVIHTNT